MSEQKRDKTGLHKEISSIFKGIPDPKNRGGQRPSDTPAPERIADTKPESPAPEQKHQASKVNKDPQSLPKGVPVKRPKPVSTQRPKAVPVQRLEPVPVQRPKPVPVQRPKPVSAQCHEVVSTKHHRAVSAERQKTIPTKQQKALYIHYLKIAGIVWAACFVVLMLAYVFIFRPQKNFRKLSKSRLTEKKQIYDSALRTAQKETRVQLNEQIERLQNRLKDFVADFEDSANLTFEISQIANEKKVVSFSIKGKDNLALSGEPVTKHISENHIVINFIGGFNQFATFLNALERHRPVLFVDKFTIARSGQDDSVYRVNLNIAAFVRKQQEEKTTDKRLDKVYGMKI